MKPRRIVDGVDWVGAIDWDNRLFDSLVPLPDGTSYNAYLVQGTEKTALIDTVEHGFEELLLGQISHVGKLDYLIANHAEQDHSAAIPAVLARHPEAVLLCSVKAKRLLVDLLDIDVERIRTVKDGETIELGGKTLSFVYTPWVHWPETMSTYLVEDRILFSCDFFGSHLATSDLFAPKDGSVIEPAKRYYAEIMMPFRKHISKNMEKVDALDIAMVAPSHGPIHDHPATILDAYREWAGAPPRNRVVIPYVTMHNSTRRMARHLVDAMIDRGVAAEQFDLTATDLGKLAVSLVDAGTIVIATPTVLEGPHPLAAYCAYVINALQPKARFVAAVGSFSWNSKALDKLQGMLADLNVEWLPEVYGRGLPKSETADALDELADTIAAKHRESGLM
ncbi:MAG: FprA family A-type flavoprotein [Rhodospirillales bacterium]|nr:FprA family A-type flavoprotein [Rhodospirillales bacterium]